MKKLKIIAVVVLFVLLCFACLIPLFALYQYAVQKQGYYEIYQNTKDVAIYLIPIILSIVGIGTFNSKK